MKRFLLKALAFAVILSVAVCPALAAFTSTASKLDPIPKGDDVIVRFAVGSDIHIGYGDSEAKLENAYAAMKRIGGVDAFIAAGDLTEGGTPEQLATYQSIVAKNSEKLTVEVDGFTGKGAGTGAAVGTTISMLGNHECYNPNIEEDFRAQVGQETEKIYWLAGKVPVIKVSLAVAGNSSNFETKHDYIVSAVKEVEATGYKGHIFLISHIGFEDTLFGDYQVGDRYDPATREFLKDYPQLVHISGHSHPDPMNPGVIDQAAGFTSVITGTVGKYYRQCEDTLYGSSITVFDVKKDGTTELYRVDLGNGKLIYGNERWILDSAQKPEDFIYFNDPAKATNPNAYALKGSAPIYGEGAAVTVKDNGDYDSIDVTFTANAKPASDKNYDYVESYNIYITPVKGGETLTMNVYNDPSAPFGADRTVTIYGLEYDTDYEVSVTAEGAFGKTSAPIKAKNTVNVDINDSIDTSLKTLYRVDYSYGDETEFKGHSGKLVAPTKLVTDETIGKTAASFGGMNVVSYDFDLEDIDAIRHAFTLEVYFKLVDTEPYQQIISLKDAFVNLGVENGTLSAYVELARGAGSYSVCHTTVEENEWTHVILTYDNKKARLYVNGELTAEESHSGGLKTDIDTSFGKLTLGGYAMTTDNLAKGSMINMFSLSQGTMTAEQAKAAYTATTSTKPMAFADVSSSDWFYSTVGYAYNSGLMSGTSSTTFAPATQTSRAMIVQLLYNMEGRPAVDVSNNPFTDVPSTEWYAPAVLWAYQNGVTTGTSATTFSPDTLVTREQVAVFLYRYMKDYKKAEMA
ncbi:MAG: S-layer homology domain-containing protein, partial [Clostridia bacterium]|nr:S-layer homology domain-containing protein [Clostridia bacterium]